jgi:ribokinase
MLRYKCPPLFRVFKTLGVPLVKFYVIGDVTVDHMHFLEKIPLAGEDATPIRSALLPGGAGGTMAYHAAKLGHQVTLAARVGDDPFQTVALSHLQASGVNLKTVQRDTYTITSTVTILVTPNAERTMISASGANRNLDAAELKRSDIEQSDALIVSAYALIGGMQREYTVKAIDAAKKAAVPVFIDLGTGAVNAAGTQLLDTVKTADYLLMNQMELLRITGSDSISEALGHLEALGMTKVVIKVGALGAIIWTPQESELIEGYTIADVADTTGAGDAFTAAFAHAVLQDFDLRRSAFYANVAGALAASHIGAQGAQLEHDDIMQRLQDFERTKTEKTASNGKRPSKSPAPKPRSASEAIRSEPSHAAVTSSPVAVSVEPVVVAVEPEPTKKATRTRKRVS